MIICSAGMYDITFLFGWANDILSKTTQIKSLPGSRSAINYSVGIKKIAFLIGWMNDLPAGTNERSFLPG